MRVALVLSLFLIGLKSQAQCPPAELAKLRNNAQVQIDWLNRELTNSNTGGEDFSLRLERFQNQLARCEMTPSEFGVGDKQIASWRERAGSVMANRLLMRIDAGARHRNVEREIEEYRRIAQQLGLPIPNEELNYWLRMGQQNEQQIRASCGPVDLRGEALGEVRNQGTIGWCFGFSAADLISHRIGQRVSALSMAANFYTFREARQSQNEEKNELAMQENSRGVLLSTTGGGTLAGAIERSQNNSLICLEEHVNTEDNGASRLIQQFTILENAAEVESSEPFVVRCQRGLEVAQTLFPQLALNDYLNILTHSDSFSFVQALIQEACVPLEVGPFQMAIVRRGPDFFATIDAQFDRGNPVGIVYNARHLREPEYIGTNEESHISTLAGRRFNEGSGECEYLIRNSWGRGCHGYHESYQCEAGNIWVPRSVIERSALNATYIE